MSLIHTKKILTALLLFLAIAHCSTASAQMSQGRLWSPVASDQFGGGARLRSGFWGEIDYNYWLITQGKDRALGFTDTPIGSPYYYDFASHNRKNTMSTDVIDQDFHNGTTIRFGNQIGHHGWELKTTILQAQSSNYTGTRGEMDVNDEYSGSVANYLLYHDFYYDPVNNPYGLPRLIGPNDKIGALWGWVEDGYDMDGNLTYVVTPLQLFLDTYTLRSRVSHWDVEANYIFRMHPTRFGFFEFTGGIRYFQLDDSLGLRGIGMVDTILENPNWVFSANNHIVGPQVGIRYIRKIGRWSLNADTKFFAGFNAQYVSSRSERYYSGTFIYNPGNSFDHSKSMTEFSPAVEIGLKANWQMTDAIGFNLGYQGMYIDNTARASLVNDYTIFPTGQVFGISQNVNDSTWMHGFTIGITINRF